MAEQFAADWLSLREHADHLARETTDLSQLSQYLPMDRTVQILDLGTGTGSNLRYLARRLPGANQHWVLLDHDAQLLEQAKRSIHTSDLNSLSIDVHYQQTDLADFAHYPRQVDLITASALLDLVSPAWIDALVDYAQRHHAPVLVALSYDGRIDFDPALADDQCVRDWVNQHQRGPKDMGSALGPDATEYAKQAFIKAGYTVQTTHSDWQLSADQMALKRATMAGWHQAALAIAPDQAERLDHWLQQRIERLNQTTLTVGHSDLLALPCPD